MNFLVTAGNTQTPIDQVRCLTNIFSGKTGGRIAIEAIRRGHAATLFTSRPDVISELAANIAIPPDLLSATTYRTFDELSVLMEAAIPGGGFDAIVHAAAVSDYALDGIFASDQSRDGELVDVKAGKLRSDYSELWLRLVPAPKLVDRIRRPWDFNGTLVKFKLEVGLSDGELLEVAERSRLQSGADLMVANTLEGMNDFAYVGPLNGRYERVVRADLAGRVISLIENCVK
jgi:phosphopantothenate---cysteine ligase (CTP)